MDQLILIFVRNARTGVPLSLGLYTGAVTSAELNIIAELMVHLWLATLSAHGVVRDTPWSAVSCPGTRLSPWHLHETRGETVQVAPTITTVVQDETKTALGTYYLQ